MPFDVLCFYAEVLHIKLPIQPNDLAPQSSAYNCFTKYFYPSEDVIAKEADFFTAPFKKDQLSCFYEKDKEKFFTPAMRSRMVRWKSKCRSHFTFTCLLLICRRLQAYYVLNRASYEVKGNMKKFGFSKLLSGGVYKDAYPLHDVSDFLRQDITGENIIRLSPVTVRVIIVH